MSLNYRDLLIARRFDATSGSKPIIPLSDGAGEVVATGTDVVRFAIGDRVTSCFFPLWLSGEPTREITSISLGGNGTDGVLCTYRLFDEHAAMPVPDHLSMIEAATLPCAALTAFNAVSAVAAGETILVLGTGGVSLFALQFAHFAGARVIATSSRDEKCARLRKMGAETAINYSQTPEWADGVLALTNGRGVDHVIEVGGPDTLPQSIKATRQGGTISLIGTLSSGQINPSPIMSSSLNVRGIRVGSRAMFEKMNARISENQLRPFIDRVFPFTESIDAYRYLAMGNHVGKIVIDATA